MKILITGAKGFIGKNLILRLTEQGQRELLLLDIDTGPDTLAQWAQQAEFVFHLAGVNRTRTEAEFDAGNRKLTQDLLGLLEMGKKPPVVLSSTIHADGDTPYGRSKKAAEEAVFAYGRRTGAPVYVYRLPSVFGRGCRPYYNSAVATFCHNIARDLPIEINDPAAPLTLAAVDDVCQSFLGALQGRAEHDSRGFIGLPVQYETTVGTVAALIHAFRDGRASLEPPNTGDPLIHALYGTYLSCLPQGSLGYPLTVHGDGRGLFTEFLRSPERGQVSVNVLGPGVTRGNHYHHAKCEKFLAAAGRGVIRLRDASGGPVTEIPVTAGQPQVVDIPPGVVHCIVNPGPGELVMVIWASQCHDERKPDTYPMEV